MVILTMKNGFELFEVSNFRTNYLRTFLVASGSTLNKAVVSFMTQILMILWTKISWEKNRRIYRFQDCNCKETAM